jgi:transposase
MGEPRQQLLGKRQKPFGKLRLNIVRRCDQARGFTVLSKRWIVERTSGWFTNRGGSAATLGLWFG